MSNVWWAVASAFWAFVAYQVGRWVKHTEGVSADRASFAEGRDSALANAAMVAYDMGRPDIRKAINGLMPADSVHLPIDDDRRRK